MTARWFRLLLLALLFLPAVTRGCAAESPAPSPPVQAAFGPGGAAAQYSRVVPVRVGSPPEGYWLFLPDGASTETTEPLPVVLFLHGYTAVDPEVYRGWIDHLVLRGAVVIYPDYQTADPFEVPWARMLPNVVAATHDALHRLDADVSLRVDRTRLAVIGHSLGGVLAVSVAAIAPAARLPEIPALMIVQPGGCAGCGNPQGVRGLEMPDLGRISPDTRMLVVIGDRDGVVGDRAARLIWEKTPQIPDDRRDAIVFRTDTHGEPDLEADHSLPQTGPVGGRVDSLDWRGAWKLFDLLAACALAGHCEGAMNGSFQQRDMGLWSDGVRVLQPVITDTLPPPDVAS